MLRIIENTPKKIELLFEPDVLDSTSFTENEIRLIARTASSKILESKKRLSIYNIESKTEFVFEKKKIEDNVHYVSLIKVNENKELLLNQGLLTFFPKYKIDE